MVTVKRYLSRLGGPAPFIFCVFNNQDLNQVTWEQRAEAGDPKFPGSQDIPGPFHKYAELLGLRGICRDQPGKVGAAWDEALASDGPVALEFRTDPDVPPLPAHLMKGQAMKSVKAEIRDPEKAGLARHGFRQKMAGYCEKLPGRDK